MPDPTVRVLIALAREEPAACPAQGSRGLKFKRAPVRGRIKLPGALEAPEVALTCRERRQVPRSDAP
ncbi:hypothetical protein NDU88_005196 [Pleurodeles waltl]|uniref:Uncharacterized protein n=1 Tax=Pleurodeles waltl TaxID=8319 RepID=A0AAV7NPV8_PLEWA|nr:hypothetical protein NDU88_005196 [Pleurodeles waltl]